MIINDLYQSNPDYTIDSGLTPSPGVDPTDYDTEMTDQITSHTCGGDTDITKAYFLYYVNWEDLPSVFKASTIEFTNDEIRAVVQTQPQNIAGTYVGRYSAGGGTTAEALWAYDYTYDPGTDKAISTTGVSDLSYGKEYYNNYSIRKSTISFMATNRLMVFARNNTYNLYCRSSSAVIPHNDFLNFLLGEGTLDCSCSGWSGVQPNPGTVSFTGIARAAFDQNGFYSEDRTIGEDSWTFIIAITDYYVSAGRDYNYAGLVTDYSSPIPMLRIYDNGACHFRAMRGGTIADPVLGGGFSHDPDDNRIRIDLSGTPTIHNTPMYMGETYGDVTGILGGFEFSVDRSVVQPAMATSGFLSGNCFLYKETQSRLLIWRFYRPSEILTHLRLNNAFVKDTSEPVQFDFSDNKLIPKFDANDLFLNEWVSGELEDIEGELRPWQLETFKTNTFDPDDMPPYTPEPDVPIVPPDEGDWGARIPWNTFQMGDNPFSHFEQMNYSAMAEFIGQLWAAPQTFWEALSASREISANLNDYLISCRAYPIFINGANAHNDIYIGVGGKISMSNTVYTPPTVSICSCGGITVNRHYGSFLDYLPYTSATIYLPFAGQFEINPKYLYDATLYLTLWVDLTDGSGVWVLRNDTHAYPILVKQCQVGIDIPVSGQDAAQKGANIVNATLTTAQHALSGFKNIVNAGAPIGGAIKTGVMTAETAIGTSVELGEELAGIAIQGLSDAYNMGMANKELPYYSTGSAGAAAAEANFEPYITLRIPLSQNPSNFAHTVGNLVNQTAAISGLNGFTICRNVDVSGISSATTAEKAQIKQILENGFYA